MSNTIRKGRKRPRVRSYSFRTLGWLIRREAALAVLSNHQTPANPSYSRYWISGLDGRLLARRVADFIRREPSRRFTP